MAARGHQKVVAVVSGGNIDLKRFAELIGACDKQPH
jgi:threonine dehydratase